MCRKCQNPNRHFFWCPFVGWGNTDNHERCDDCGKPIVEGHIDCNCHQSHPEENCGKTDNHGAPNLQPLTSWLRKGGDIKH